MLIGDGDLTRPAETASADRTDNVDPITAPADDSEPVPMSLDRDAGDRTFDRQLAYLGLLDDAAPLFREGASVPGAGVLLGTPVRDRERVISDQPQALRRDRLGLLWPAHDIADARSSDLSISRNETPPHSVGSLGSTAHQK
jgi:hypothetical protein